MFGRKTDNKSIGHREICGCGAFEKSDFRVIFRYVAFSSSFSFSTARTDVACRAESRFGGLLPDSWRRFSGGRSFDGALCVVAGVGAFCFGRLVRLRFFAAEQSGFSIRHFYRRFEPRLRVAAFGGRLGAGGFSFVGAVASYKCDRSESGEQRHGFLLRCSGRFVHPLRRRFIVALVE